MKFLIRVSASPGIGNGHFMRCISLAHILMVHKYKVYFLTDTKNAMLLHRLETENIKYQIITVNTIKADAQITVESARWYGIDWVITDGYQFTTNYQKEIKDAGFKLLSIDDIAQYHFVSDIILNQNLLAEKRIKYSCESYTKKLLGIQYMLIRKELYEYKEWKREIVKDARKLLITMGGSDSYNYTLKILQALQKVPGRFDISVLVGSNYEYLQELTDFNANAVVKAKILRNMYNPLPLFQETDIVLAAAGITMWELAFLQTPMILGIIAENQSYGAKLMQELDYAVNIGWYNGINNDSMLDSILRFADDYDLRKRLSQNLERELHINECSIINEIEKYNKEY